MTKVKLERGSAIWIDRPGRLARVYSDRSDMIKGPSKGGRFSYTTCVTHPIFPKGETHYGNSQRRQARIG